MLAALALVGWRWCGGRVAPSTGRCVMSQAAPPVGGTWKDLSGLFIKLLDDIGQGKTGHQGAERHRLRSAFIKSSLYLVSQTGSNLNVFIS